MEEFWWIKYQTKLLSIYASGDWHEQIDCIKGDIVEYCNKRKASFRIDNNGFWELIDFREITEKEYNMFNKLRGCY